MKIKMKTLLAGPYGVRQPESVHDVSNADAEKLIAGNFAEEYIDPEVVRADAAAKAKADAAAKAKADAAAKAGKK